jgi:hypothetical protein
MPPRKTPQTPDQQAQVSEQLPPLSEEAREAFNTGIKRTVTPRKGEATDVVVRQFYTDQALEVMDQLEVVYNLIKDMADPKGNVDLMGIVRAAKEEVLAILVSVLEQERQWVGRLEIDDLLMLFGDVYNINVDFFVHRVKERLKVVSGQVSTLF